MKEDRYTTCTKVSSIYNRPKISQVSRSDQSTDIFYIPDPTLMFVGVPFYTATFSLFDFQAIAVAAVVSGQATLPSTSEMRREYLLRVEQKGFDRHFHSLKGQEESYVAELLLWINKQIQYAGKNPIAGYSQVWHDAKSEQVRLFEVFCHHWNIELI